MLVENRATLFEAMSFHLSAGRKTFIDLRDVEI